ncbi:VWA domain-containing protein [Flammeovirga sp. SR4]|uniref:VWA domain-containing protein n=2 Tax=Flammeovirga agarivorans TaxID=2726742 RepID=A0A7X8XZA4_9BACT|nr:VWA domain-containing protein [Flammeovirga agarivorans]NLR94805.1 VWA domain-containing protein [Flammeovirga agarivorans]
MEDKTSFDEIEKFKMFSSLGETDDRQVLASYLTEIARGHQPDIRNSEFSDMALGYKFIIDDILETPGLKDSIHRHASLRDHVVKELITHIENIAETTSEPPQIDRQRKRLSLPFGMRSGNANGDKGRSTKGMMSKLIESVRKMLGGKTQQKQDDLKKKLSDNATKFDKSQHLISQLMDHLGLGFEKAKGKWQSTGFDVLTRYERLLEDEEMLKELVELLGRYASAELEEEKEQLEEISIQPFRRTFTHGKESLIGVHESDDLSQILPTEAALLGNEDTELIFYKKFVEHKLQTFELKAEERPPVKEEGKKSQKVSTKEDVAGPVILCIDTSASMLGKPEQIAKTLCFAIMKMALENKRECILFSFGATEDEIEKIDLSNLREGLEPLIHFLSMSFSAGTNAGPALHAAIDQMQQPNYKMADLILITDGKIPELSTDILHKLRKAQSKDSRFYAVTFGAENAPELKPFDLVWKYRASKKESLAEFARKIKKLKRKK